MTRRGRRRTTPGFACATAIALMLSACTAVQPAGVVAPVGLSGSTFPHDHLDRVLSRHVDDRGRVDYEGIEHDPADLERYYLMLTYYSPDNHPELFPTEQDRLAYWINAYNGSVLEAVIAHYPIDSVTDVVTPFPLSVGVGQRLASSCSSGSSSAATR